ncbi:hypothetical protein FGO68_gene13309 [Halteria grandinella]|uniref:Uncharacterized protein n=1 Tax=Halteria grandinella TaxID=5974 RepID=A0A8J8SVX3_HALGN|nr:hypothetical protein FGO68_gene13309 [Halteria grandinella]
MLVLAFFFIFYLFLVIIAWSLYRYISVSNVSSQYSLSWQISSALISSSVRFGEYSNPYDPTQQYTILLSTLNFLKIPKITQAPAISPIIHLQKQLTQIGLHISLVTHFHQKNVSRNNHLTHQMRAWVLWRGIASPK